MIYLDNSATTRPCPACVRAMTEALTDCWGNPSSVYALGIDAAHRLRQARQAVAAALGAEPDRVFFTSGGTEADNWAILSAAERLGKRGRHIITTAVEHHAVLHPMQKLEAKGFEVTYLQPDHDGNITVEELKKALRPDTILVSVMMVNNETGAVMPIADMVKAMRRAAPLALFHTDAVQGFLKVPFRAKALGADMISVSAHKIHAAKGTGALYIRPGLPLPAFLNGGGQESNYRSGTENMPAPHIVNLSLPGLRSQGIINCLQSDGIYVSAGSACSKGHRSHVLEAMHLSPAVIDGSIRVSFSRDNTEADVDALCHALLHAKQTLKG